jgi:hypothetical protein
LILVRFPGIYRDWLWLRWDKVQIHNQIIINLI